MAVYTYASDGSYPTGIDWPPPLTEQFPDDPDKSLSGSPQGLIQWSRGADLAIIFCVTDVYNANPFLPGYKIPTTLMCRSGPFVPARTIPMSLLHQSAERWGFLDDQQRVPGPKGCFLISDYEYYTQNSTILVVGVSMGSSATNWLRAVSAMSGASKDESTNGNVISGSSDATTLANACFAEVVTYANRVGARTIDLVFTCDNTGSMGGSRQAFKNAAVLTTAQVLAAGYDGNFAFSTFADWSNTDVRLAYFGPGGNWGSSGDDPYNIRFPFGPLTQERQDAFAAGNYPGQGGADTPETAIEALCRIYQARAAFELQDKTMRTHFW